MGGKKYYYIISPYSWNSSTSNIWESSYLQWKWPTLLCRYVSEACNGRITTKDIKWK
jgi:hypothetical protein